MMSKISFYKLIRQKIKQNIWIPFLISAVGFLIMPAAFQVAINSYRIEEGMRMSYEGGPAEGVTLMSWISRVAEAIVGEKSPLLMASCIIAGVLCAFAMFGWLYSQEQVDFWHSLSVRRGRLFAVSYLTGILISVIPFVCNHLIATLLVPVIKGVWHPVLLRVGLRGMVSFLLCFLAVYSFCVLAIMLTGRWLTGIFMIGLLFFYLPVVYWLINWLSGVFFPSLYLTDSIGLIQYMSPVTMIATFFRASSFWIRNLLLFSMALAALVLSLLVYVRRQSEGIGKALVLRGMGSLVKVFSLVPGAFLFGAAFSIIGFLDQSAFRGVFVFAVIFGGAFLTCILEFLYSFDLRDVLRHWRSAAVTFGLIAAALIFFLADPLRIDAWLPDEEDVEAMAFDSQVLFEEFGSSYGEIKIRPDSYMDQFGPIYELAAEGREKSDESEGIWILIGYRMKNGSEHIRQYYLDPDRIHRALEEIQDLEGFHEAYNPDVYIDFGRYDYMDLLSMNLKQTTAHHELDPSESGDLESCLREDAVTMSYDDYCETLPLAMVSFDSNFRYGSEGDHRKTLPRLDIYIYPQFRKTIDCLKSMGYEEIFQESDYSRLSEIRLDFQLEYMEDLFKDHPSWRDRFVRLTDKKDIQDFFEITRPVKGSRWREDAVQFTYFLEGDSAEKYSRVMILDFEALDHLIERGSDEG